MKIRKSYQSSPSFRDKLRNQIDEILTQLTDLSCNKEKIISKYNQAESKILKSISGSIIQEKIKTKERTDVSCNPIIKKSAEEIAIKEKNIENLMKANKAMKTLLAEMTLNLVDTKLSISHDRQLKTEILTCRAFIKKYAKVEANNRNLNLNEFWKGDMKKSIGKNNGNYAETVARIVDEGLVLDGCEIGDVVEGLCKGILEEQSNRLKSEETADRMIHEKNCEIGRLEEMLRTK